MSPLVASNMSNSPSSRRRAVKNIWTDPWHVAPPSSPPPSSPLPLPPVSVAASLGHPSTPPSRPPRPQTSLPDLRPRVVLCAELDRRIQCVIRGSSETLRETNRSNVLHSSSDSNLPKSSLTRASLSLLPSLLETSIDSTGGAGVRRARDESGQYRNNLSPTLRQNNNAPSHVLSAKHRLICSPSLAPPKSKSLTYIHNQRTEVSAKAGDRQRASRSKKRRRREIALSALFVPSSANRNRNEFVSQKQVKPAARGEPTRSESEADQITSLPQCDGLNLAPWGKDDRSLLCGRDYSQHVPPPNNAKDLTPEAVSNLTAPDLIRSIHGVLSARYLTQIPHPCHPSRSDSQVKRKKPDKPKKSLSTKEKRGSWIPSLPARSPLRLFAESAATSPDEGVQFDGELGKDELIPTYPTQPSKRTNPGCSSGGKAKLLMVPVTNLENESGNVPGSEPKPDLPLTLSRGFELSKTALDIVERTSETSKGGKGRAVPRDIGVRPSASAVTTPVAADVLVDVNADLDFDVESSVMIRDERWWRRRRYVYIVATFLFVVGCTAGILAGVIWRLSVI